jgi:hypothetical protein
MPTEQERDEGGNPRIDQTQCCAVDLGVHGGHSQTSIELVVQRPEDGHQLR